MRSPRQPAANQHALGVEPVQQVMEALAFLRRSCPRAAPLGVDEHLVGVDRRAATYFRSATSNLGAVEGGVEV